MTTHAMPNALLHQPRPQDLIKTSMRPGARLKLNSHNEWDELREVIVGSVERQACLAFTSSRPVSEEMYRKIAAFACEAFPQRLLDEANEDVESLCALLRKSGVNVLRPDTSDVGKPYATCLWSAGGDRMYNMRDLHLVVGNTVLECASQERHRFLEATGLYEIWSGYFKQGCRWIAAPRPRLAGQYLTTHDDGGQRYQTLTEDEILFEAANILRVGKDLLYLVSRSGNYLGAKWIQSVLGDEYRVHTTEIYRSSHIDSTILCLRPGLVLLNASRVSERNCPKIFDKWDKIYFSDIAPTPVETLELHEHTRTRIHKELAHVGISTDIAHLASDWIGMNLLSLDPQTVIVDERQIDLIKTLQRYKIMPIPVSFRHSHLLKGGIHCSTLDTVRASTLENYCD